jgi:hypothetical protein
MAHDRRPEHDARHPVQVTMRATNAPNLRTERFFPVVRAAIGRASRSGFRIVHFSVQQDHLHLIVEAGDRLALRNGIRGLAIRIALAVNRARGRRGALFVDRFHARPLTTPREVRVSLVYVLLNFRKHLRAPAGVDPCSSGPWFDGWAKPPESRPGGSPVVPARTWLGAAGWQRGGGRVNVGERPTAGRRRCTTTGARGPERRSG